MRHRPTVQVVCVPIHEVIVRLLGIVILHVGVIRFYIPFTAYKAKTASLLPLHHVQHLRVRDQLQLDVGQKKHGIPSEGRSGHIICRVKLVIVTAGLPEFLEDIRQKQNVSFKVNGMVI